MEPSRQGRLSCERAFAYPGQSMRGQNQLLDHRSVRTRDRGRRPVDVDTLQLAVRVGQDQGSYRIDPGRRAQQVAIQKQKFDVGDILAGPILAVILPHRGVEGKDQIGESIADVIEQRAVAILAQLSNCHEITFTFFLPMIYCCHGERFDQETI